MATNTNPNSIYYLSPRIDTMMAIIQGRSVQEKAREINRTIGTFTAARFMANRGWSIEAAIYVLLGK